MRSIIVFSFVLFLSASAARVARSETLTLAGPDQVGATDHSDPTALSLWLDREVVKRYLSILKDSKPALLTQILDSLLGIQIYRAPGAAETSIGIYFDSPWTTSLDGLTRQSHWYLRALSMQVPRTLRINAGFENGLLKLKLDQALDQPLTLELSALGMHPQSVVHEITADTESGELEVDAGVLGDTVDLVAKGRFKTFRLEGLDLPESVSKNYEDFKTGVQFIDWPLLFRVP